MENTLKTLYIIGASGFGREVADTIHAINKANPTYNVAGFIDDDQSKWGTVINDIPVPGGVDYLANLSKNGNNHTLAAVIAIAEPKIKEFIAEKLNKKVDWENIIHPTAIVSQYAQIGIGNIFQANVIIGANALVGDHNAINVSSSLGHDAVLKNYVSIMGHCDITGHCALGDRVYIATSVSIIPSITVEQDAFIGAGSVVLRRVKAGHRVFGTPAKSTKL
jgi:sugar O-acyltransferase (sialic acid O-acetyltransferase NeuD family)